MFARLRTRRLAHRTGLSVAQLHQVADADRFLRVDVGASTLPLDEYVRRDATATEAVALIATRTPTQRQALAALTPMAEPTRLS